MSQKVPGIVAFELDGHSFTALNGGPTFTRGWRILADHEPSLIQETSWPDR